MNNVKLATPRVTIILPHRESFSPLSAGAVAMVVQRFATGQSRYRSLVLGPPVRGQVYPDVDFRPVHIPKYLPLTITQSYAARLSLIIAGLPPGIVEVHNKPDVAMWLARLFPSRPVILFLHNDPRTMRGARSPRSRRELLARLARIITVSEYLRRALLSDVIMPPQSREPAVVHNALDQRILPERLPAHLREKLILFAGRIVPDKAPDVFVTACANALPLLPGWRAAMIGADGFSSDGADTSFIRQLREKAARAGIAMLGYQPHESVLQAMAQAAIVIVPSRWEEPFGMTALEAMACGAALICSNRGGLAEVAGNAAIPIDPDNADGVAQALLRLANDSALRTTLSAAGEHRARTWFDGAEAMKKLDGLRDQALDAWR